LGSIVALKILFLTQNFFKKNRSPEQDNPFRHFHAPGFNFRY